MWDSLIIGSGPAGLGAAIYGKRAGLSVLVAEKEYMGTGQIAESGQVDNYLGLVGKSGYDLGEIFLEDAKKIAANNAINFYKQETGGNHQPTNIKYQHKTTQASDTSKGISQTTYSVLAVLVF